MILTNTERQVSTFEIENIPDFKRKALAWATRFELCCYLDSNSNDENHHKQYEFLIGVGKESELLQTAQNSFDALQAYQEQHKDWLFGFITYDVKNDVEKLSSNNIDQLNFPNLHFFQPTTVLTLQSKTLEIQSKGLSPERILQQIKQTQTKDTLELKKLKLPKLQQRFSKAAYIKTVESIKQHIIEGDIYEMNFCQEFYIENAKFSPLDVFIQLNELAKAPFASFYKLKDKFSLCASPERYLTKRGRTLISQPIKGTIRRGDNSLEDLDLKQALYKSKKDRAENVMIVDLVRNDLARICEAGSVKVEELFGIYQFEQVFQMISTIKGLMREDVSVIDGLRYTFPMGSMTGAPKVMAMKLIEQYEKSKRGLYSGTIGYISPDGDFDFNVVIRSMLYDAATNYLSFQVGGAIVYDSVPDLEYEECLLKAKAILNIIQKTK